MRSVLLRPLGTRGLDLRSAREALSPDFGRVMQNVRPYLGKLESAPGMSDLVSGLATGGTPTFVLSWLHDDGSFRVNIGTTTKLYKLDPTTGALTDITQGAGYGASPQGPFDVTTYGTTLIAAMSPNDNIQKWDGTAATALDLGGAPPKCGTLAAALSYLFIGNIASNPRLIRWSDTGNAEAWAGGDSGSLTLYQAPGPVLRLKPLGEVVIVYRRDNIHLLYYVGPPFIWAQRQIITSHGLFAPQLVADLGTHHLYAGSDNFYLFDGVSRQPVGDKIIDTFLGDIDPANTDTAFAAIDKQDRKVFFCYAPLGTAGKPTRAFVFDYLDGSWHRETYPINLTAAGNFRRVTGQTWNTITGAWNAQVLSWLQLTAFSQNFPAVIFMRDNGGVELLDKTTYDVVGFAREKLYESGLYDPGAQLFEKTGSRCTLMYLDLDFESQPGTTLQVAVGTQNELLGDGSITWTTYTNTLDGTTVRIPIGLTARYFAIRFRNASTGQPFRGSGVTAWFSSRGDR